MLKKKEIKLLRKEWLARPENNRLWSVLAEAIADDNEEEKWIEYLVPTTTILLDHAIQQDCVGLLLGREPLAIRFAEWTRTSMQRTPSAIVWYLERHVWQKDARELREVVFRGYNPRYIEDTGRAISHILRGKELLSCHYGSMDSPIDLYSGLEESNISNDGITVLDMVEWGPFSII